MRGLALLLALALASAAQAQDSATIEPQALAERLAWGDQALVVLDVRTAAEFAEGHLPGARNIPHTELAARIAELEGDRARDIVVYCLSGNRSAQALGTLDAAGFKRLFHLQGDYPAWSAKRPVVIPPQ
jgi:rhodanese-related sulfurtransferase